MSSEVWVSMLPRVNTAAHDLRNAERIARANMEVTEDDDWVDDVPTSPKDSCVFHVGEDWEFSPGFWAA
jgi:hypothetical protein